MYKLMNHMHIISETDEFQTVFSRCDGIAKGITIKGNVTCIYDDEDTDVI